MVVQVWAVSQEASLSCKEAASLEALKAVLVEEAEGEAKIPFQAWAVSLSDMVDGVLQMYY